VLLDVLLFLLLEITLLLTLKAYVALQRGLSSFRGLIVNNALPRSHTQPSARRCDNRKCPKSPLYLHRVLARMEGIGTGRKRRIERKKTESQPSKMTASSLTTSLFKCHITANSLNEAGGFAAEVGRAPAADIDRYSCSAALHAGRVTSGPIERRSNILVYRRVTY